MNTALQEKAANYCVAGERCRQSVRKKIADWGGTEADADEIVEWLVANRFVDETRYARAFCSSKYRYQHWGRKKIAFELRLKRLSADDIAEGLSVVGDEEYAELVRGVAEGKWRTLRGDERQRRNKLIAFLLSRGYDLPLAREVAESLH